MPTLYISRLSGAFLSSAIILIVAASALCRIPTCYGAEGDREVISLLKNGGARVEDSSGKTLFAYRDNDLFIPASTMKLATSFCAIKVLGEAFRYKTNFYTSETGTLYVVGSGDPWLVSEELAIIAEQLANKIKRVESIVIDTSFFDSPIVIDGASASTNPYDARNSAFVGNFSTAFISRRGDGSVVSAEPQTPITPLSREAGSRLSKGATERINLGADWKIGTRYGGELLAAMLSSRGVSGSMQVSIGELPSQSAKLVLSHTSSQSLRDLLAGLLHYSTNFTANQLFLTMGATRFGAPATVAKGQRALNECLTSEAGWRGFTAEEGSGLSRKTSVSPKMMTMLLARFEPYKMLLKDENGFAAKTGTLTGVNTLAGYFKLPNGSSARFAILINSAVPATYKFTVAQALRKLIVARVQQ